MSDASATQATQATQATPTAKQMQDANKKIINTLVTKGTEEAFKELMKHPTTGQGLSYAESRMYYG